MVKYSSAAHPDRSPDPSNRCHRFEKSPAAPVVGERMLTTPCPKNDNPATSVTSAFGAPAVRRASPPCDSHPDRPASMILSGEEIRRHLGSQIVIDPFSADRLNTNSYNLALHHELLVYEEVVLDAAAPNRFRRIQIPEAGLTLHPGQLYLGRTQEHTETRGLVPRIQGRSSLARLGLFISPGASLGEAGYCGTWTL